MIHVVESGETLFAIGRLYGIPAEEIASYNGLTAPDLLVPGQTLVIPGGGADESIGTLASYGYAYPFTGEPVLEAALPHLSGMASFAYGFTTAGDLVKADDAATVGTALEFGAAPIMTLSTLGADGAFSNELGSLLLSSESMQDILLGQTLAEMREKGFRILDLDFEYVYRRDAERYAGFVARARDLLSPEGYKVICDLAPKTSDGQPGLLYEGHDYAALGEAADLVLLMTYEWGYTYGPPMAVAPINNVRRVVEYGLTRIPAEKIMMGVPNYGYDWPLPFVSGNTKARSIGCEEAVSIARENGADISYSEESRSPFFSYTRNGTAHEVWFEDARSILSKLSLAAEYALFGFGIWNLTRPFTQMWTVYEDYFARRGL